MLRSKLWKHTQSQPRSRTRPSGFAFPRKSWKRRQEGCSPTPCVFHSVRHLWGAAMLLGLRRPSLTFTLTLQDAFASGGLDCPWCLFEMPKQLPPTAKNPPMVRYFPDAVHTLSCNHTAPDIKCMKNTPQTSRLAQATERHLIKI